MWHSFAQILLRSYGAICSKPALSQQLLTTYHTTFFEIPFHHTFPALHCPPNLMVEQTVPKHIGKNLMCVLPAGGSEVRAHVEPRDPHWRHLRLANAHFGFHLQPGCCRARCHGALDLVESNPRREVASGGACRLKKSADLGLRLVKNLHYTQ